MLTKNGRKWLGKQIDSSKDISYKNTKDTSTVGTIAVWSNLKIVIGTGSTVETADDYKLEAEVPEDVKRTAWDRTCAGDNYMAQFTAVFTNNTGQAVTVKEVGLQTDINNANILMYRKTIDPVKIPAGGIKTFTVALL